ncbi:hypothetical protein T8J41_14055 [Nitratireductor rhodophyticola]|uniref:hypothetical protein n=1 Tax=Nitratireductor rhodophyticola TaxID=2854036 RepID=UPI002AC9E3C5|nr:hypothetical protein [Nitratireductor rhodophyticola]WPZ13280.1 hypothetical protein T8J41_14055 [Nitratireductor rhodophyticola]
MIVPPRRSNDDPDRQTECQAALEAEFQGLSQRAIGAGWTESEVEFAMLCLSLAEIRRRECNIETEEQILAAIRMVEGR